MADQVAHAPARLGSAAPWEAPEEPWRRDPLVLPAESAAYPAVARYVRGVVARAGLPHNPAYRLRLAVEELAVNAVQHGYQGRPGYLRVLGGADRRYVWIRLADAAPPFDPSAHRVVPDLTVPIGLRPVGGLGVHLALSAVDAFEYAYAEGENRSTVLVRRCPGRSADDERRLS